MGMGLMTTSLSVHGYIEAMEEPNDDKGFVSQRIFLGASPQSRFCLP
jgi:hypothetical protein